MQPRIQVRRQILREAVAELPGACAPGIQRATCPQYNAHGRAREAGPTCACFIAASACHAVSHSSRAAASGAVGGLFSAAPLAFPVAKHSVTLSVQSAKPKQSHKCWRAGCVVVAGTLRYGTFGCSMECVGIARSLMREWSEWGDGSRSHVCAMPCLALSFWHRCCRWRRRAGNERRRRLRAASSSWTSRTSCASPPGAT